ncbi:MAG: hypothetical protein E7562_02070 [Ruminococcaceae bacterium]|nr:hypothetical protein [Oscillospiraceae bacterium]
MKKRILKLISTVLLSVLLISGCTSQDVPLNMLRTYKLPQKVSSVKSGVIAQNDNLELSWDYEKQCVLIKDKNSGYIWSTIPYDFYISGETADSYRADGICSALRVTYLDTKTQTENEVNTNFDASYVNVEKSDIGIRITYYFDKVKISVPITFILEEDGLSVSVENSLITEGENKVISVALLPFLASAPNDDASYLFVPSGSGALMYTDDEQRSARKYKEQVFGKDLAAQTIYEDTESESIRMPIFGAKSKEKAIFAVITAGAETAEIAAISGDNQYKFSGVYPIFNLRGSASSLVKGSANTNNNITKYPDDVVKLQKCTVKYFLLAPDKSDYNGMAECYRDYLAKNGGLKTQTKTADAIITLLGGLQERKLALGIPYHSVSTVTTFDQAKDILSDILKNTNAKLAVNLKGFGSSGLDYGETAGGFEPLGDFGGKDGLSSLNKWSINNKIDLFYDFDMVFQTESYGEFNVRESAISANDVRARFCQYDIVTREQREDVFAYLTGRILLAKSTGIITEKINDLGLKGVGLSTLSSGAYSDYKDPNYYCKAHMSDDVANILKSLKKAGLSTFGESANSYAATRLDYVYNAPVKSSKFYAIDKDIPFYQLVFRGSTVLSGEPINLSSEPKAAFLETVSTGSALSFTLCNNYNDTVFKSIHSAIALGVYDDIADTVNAFIKEAKPLQERIGNSALVSYSREDNLSKSVFSNGVTLYVNHSMTEKNTDLGAVKPQSFIFE